jgi:ABC-type transport system involved in multi-copper enzyme maturation permease subunit
MVELYLFVGLISVLFGARLFANEESSGSIFLLLSRPLSRDQVLLTKYGVCAVLLLIPLLIALLLFRRKAY